jgi:hypothetical protein
MRRVAQWLARVGHLGRMLAGELDAQTVVFVAGLGLVGYGAALVYLPAGYLAPGLVLLWWTLPSRPPFLARPPAAKEKR